jgi:hypothetical protein
MFAHKVIWKKDILRGVCKKRQKKKKVVPWIPILEHQKMSSIHETSCANIECLDLHLDIFFKIFRHLKYVFWAMGASTPMSQNAFLLLVLFLSTFKQGPSL